jgi:hypothetical protein
MRPVTRPTARSITRRLTAKPVGGNVSRMTVAEFEALTEYRSRTYIVDGVGTYVGRTLTQRAAWAPAAGDYYVSKSGSDANNGLTEGAAKLTIASAFGAISTSNAGPITIWVDAGTYAENISSTGYFYMAAKNFAHPVTIRSKPGAAVTITAVSGTFVVFFFGACGNIIFRELTIASIASSNSVLNIQSTGRASNCAFLDCAFSDAHTKATSVNANGSGGTVNFSLKRCTFTSAGAFAVTAGNMDTAYFVGNDMTGTVAGGITIAAQTMSATGTYHINSNKISGAFVLAGSTSSKLRANCYANEFRNLTHTGGDATYPSLLNISRNIVNSTSQTGIDIKGYTLDGVCNQNTVTTTANTTALAWPHEYLVQNCVGAVISNNIITNNFASGHGLLIGPGGSEIVAIGNTIYCNTAGAYGVVLKGIDCEVTGNNVYGGNLYPLLLKGARSCSIIGNTIRSTVSGTLSAIRFSTEDLDSPTLTYPANNTITGNTFIVTNGPLWGPQSGDGIGTGHVIDSNTYQISGSGTWGALFGTSITSLATLRARWAADYPSGPTNDANSSSI